MVSVDIDAPGKPMLLNVIEAVSEIVIGQLPLMGKKKIKAIPQDS